eukprot:1003-Chlamydomonas_euryale.AAC.2
MSAGKGWETSESSRAAPRCVLFPTSRCFSVIGQRDWARLSHAAPRHAAGHTGRTHALTLRGGSGGARGHAASRGDSCRGEAAAGQETEETAAVAAAAAACSYRLRLHSPIAVGAEITIAAVVREQT